MIGGVARREDYKPGVVDETVRIFKASRIALRNQGTADLVARQIDGAGRGQQVSAADMVVKKQTEAQQPGGTQPAVVGQHETKRADNVRRDLPKDFALDQRLANQPKLVIFEITQSAMHELGRPG